MEIRRSKATTALAGILLFLVLVAWQGAGGPGSVSQAGAQDDILASPQVEITCNTCADCSDKLHNAAAFTTVRLTTDLLNVGGTCVSAILSESYLTFDCDGHTIDGDDIAIDPDQGVIMLHGSHNRVTNCTISDFSRGIDMSGSYHTVDNNVTSSNGVGIYFSGSDYGTIQNNTSTDNVTGILLSQSDYNAVNTNTACDNSYRDVTVESSSGNTGDNNTCDISVGWNDYGTTGCTSLCSGTGVCNSCSSCTTMLNGGSFSRVVLQSNISYAGTSGQCIDVTADNVQLDCNGHSITGPGSGTSAIGVNLEAASSGATVQNCTVSSFGNGIRLSGALNATVQHNTLTTNGYGIRALTGSNGTTYTFNDIRTSTSYGLYVYYSDNSTISLNTLSCNNAGIRAYGSSGTKLQINTVCSKGASQYDISVAGSSSGTSGYSNRCDSTSGYNDPGVTGCSSLCNGQRCATCSDGVRNGAETGVDCGGPYCPACSSTCSSASVKYAPADTVCHNPWPTSDGPDIGMNTTSDSCDLVEVCDSDLDYIVQDALLCCENADYASRFTAPRAASKISACNYAQAQAYNSNLGALTPTSLKECLAQYIIRGLGADAIYMQGYFYGELCCYGSDHCPSACSEWCVCPHAWEMGTSSCCAGSGGAHPDFQMGGHRCEYTDAWIFGTYGKSGYWNSDTDWHSNNDSFGDIPAHASLDRLSTGTCVDYSFALTTLLRKAGYSKDDILSVNGDGHAYNLLRLPGDAKWHYVDTVGNNGGGIYGGTGYPDPQTAWYHYCTEMDDGCSNDVYSESRSHCPPNSAIFGCESVSSAALTGDQAPEAQPGTPQLAPAEGTDPTCTELHPCVEEGAIETEPPGPVINLGVAQSVSSGHIVLGESVTVEIAIQNQEGSDVAAAVEEAFVPDIDYALEAQQRSFESFTYEYHRWDVTVPAQGTRTIQFTATPKKVGTFALEAASVSADGNSYLSGSPLLEVDCQPNGTCDPGETYLVCPQDCTTGIQDGLCDMVADDVNDPDCRGAVDPDFNPAADTDGDGVVDGSDLCPLTPSSAVVDSQGCACEQKMCADEDPLTADSCNPSTAACEHRADQDQDGWPDADDNCPTTYNPEQFDSDHDGKGDQCEIGPVTAGLTLDGGTYRIYDYETTGAVVIAASGVTLDCAGATLIGNGTGYGIYIPEGINNVTIRNCHVQDYRYGIYADASSGDHFLTNTLRENVYGIVLGDTSSSTLNGNTARANDNAGLYLEGSSGNSVAGNTVLDNGNVGVFLHTSSGNDVSDNAVCGSTNSDFRLYSATNTGDDNTCDQPGEWNDAGTSGCSRPCSRQLYLPLVFKNSSS